MSEENVKAEKMCGLCSENVSKYCCPRCELFYCSLTCYKSEKHIECSESFYRDCVNEELSSNHTDEESQKKMMDILKRLRNEEEFLSDEPESDLEEIDSDDDQKLELHERLKDLNLNDADSIWNALTEDERNEFEALVKGEVSSIVPHWEPWWGYKKVTKLVEDVNGSNNEDNALKDCPALKPVPKLSILTTVQPSPAIKFNVTNVLASYAFIMRYFNGELDPTEGTSCLLNICANLDSNANFEDVATSVESVAQKCLQSDLIQTDEESLHIMRHDTLLILAGPSKENKDYYCKAALSHIHEILTQTKSLAKLPKTPTIPNGEFSRKFPEGKTHLPNLDMGKVKKCIRKLEYYLSFIESYGIDVISLNN